MMRVLHMSAEKGWRGGEQQLAYLLEDLAHAGVRNVLAVRAGSPLEKFCEQQNIPCYPVRYSNSMDLRSAVAVRGICRKERIDLVHLHSSKAHGVGVLSAVLGNRTPMVLSRRVAFLPGKNIFSRWKYSHPSVRRILCVSKKVMHIMQGYVRDPSRCTTVYSGINLRKFDKLSRDRDFITKEFNLDPEATIVAAIGALDEAKDHLTFIAAIEKLIKSGERVQGLVVGNGPLRDVLDRAVREKGLQRHVILAGHRKDVGRILLSVDIFLMPSKEEGLGTSLLDAFLARIPVVATDTGGIPEIVRDGETGLLAPVGDAARLSENVTRLIQDTCLRHKLVEGGFSLVQEFSKEETSARTYAVYQDVLRKCV